jgi:hypothetical protein
LRVWRNQEIQIDSEVGIERYWHQCSDLNNVLALKFPEKVHINAFGSDVRTFIWGKMKKTKQKQNNKKTDCPVFLQVLQRALALWFKVLHYYYLIKKRK